MAALNSAFLGVIFLAYFSCAWSFPGPDEPLPIPASYPTPRIILISPTGVGKSSLANVLAGCEPDDNTCFKTCNGGDSCTKNTTVNVVTYLGDDSFGEFTLVDTPGFGDSGSLGDGPLISNMVDVLKNTLGQANMILLCQEYGRFVPEIQTMILQLESLFGRDSVWNHVVLEVTKWSFSATDIFSRNRTGLTEEGALADINSHLMDISHLNQSLPGVFIDSWSQFFPDDEVQQQYFQDYTNQLWTLAKSMPPLSFYTIEDILDQLHECNEVLEERITNIEQSVNVNAADIRSNLNNITDIEKSVDHNGDQISTLESEVILNTFNIDSNLATISTNVNNIASNLGLINSNSQNISSNTGLITTNTGHITTNTGLITTNTGHITTNTGHITTNTGHITSHTADIKHIKDRQDTQVAQCGFTSQKTDTGPITYSGLLTNVATDHSILDTKTGTYRVLTTGQFVITFSAAVRMYTDQRAHIYLYRDGTRLYDTEYLSSYHGNNYAFDQGSKTVVLDLKPGQEIQMRADTNTASIYHIMFCINLV